MMARPSTIRAYHYEVPVSNHLGPLIDYGSLFEALKEQVELLRIIHQAFLR